MLDADTPGNPDETTAAPTATEAPASAPDAAAPAADAAPAKKAAAKKSAKKATKKTTKKAAKAATDDSGAPAPEAPAADVAADVAGEAPAPKKKAAKKAAAKPKKAADTDLQGADSSASPETADGGESAPAAPMVLFQAPEKSTTTRKRATKKTAAATEEAPAETSAEAEAPAPAPAPAKRTAKRAAKKTAAPEGAAEETPEAGADSGGETDVEQAENSESGEGESGEGGPRRRRRRGGRRRRKGTGADSDADAEDTEEADEAEDGESGEGTSRRRTRVRKPRNPEDEITSVSGSTRLEAKKQRRREGREAGRRRAPIVSEAEFLARREAVDRVMIIRQRDDLTQIGVLEDRVLVEHYVARESQTSLIGNIYLGRVQNVLPSMEAAFVDIGKGRNAVLYAGEVNWSALGHKDGEPRKVESVLKSGQTILVQVTKDPVGHKGARLTGQISLPGRFLVYVPDGNTSGISRKLPDTERNRLKTLLKEIVPDTAGVIVRTAAEGASEEELTQDVERLTARWADIEAKVKAGRAPELLYGEPDLTLKVVRDLFTEDFSKLVVQGDDAWDLVDGYVSHVAPDLRERLERFEVGQDGKDVFATYRLDEQIAKGLDRKVWLPSGGSLIIDRTEAMTVVDVNTGKFTGSGGNLEETVTKNNLEAAEEMVRQLRLRDIGGIIVIDFIDMVLESNRDLVLRRLVECLGRDRTRHQVAEVTSLGLVQMTRKRIGTGLLEAFSEDCDHCKGRGVIVHDHPIEATSKSVGMGGGVGGDEPRGRSRRGRGRGRGGDAAAPETPKPSPMALASTKPHPVEDEAPSDETAAVEPVETEATGATFPETAETEAPPAEEQAPETPAEPAAPVVKTTTRRRRAGRPAGPAGANLTEGTPAEGTPAEETPAEGTPAEETPAEETPAEETPAEETPAEETPAEETPAEETPAEETPEDGSETPVLHVPVKKKGSRKR